MANVKIFPLGSTLDLWDEARPQVVVVDFERLSAAFPDSADWLTLDELGDWWPFNPTQQTMVESDDPAAFGNAILLRPFAEVRAKVGIGDVAARIGGASIFGILALLGIGAWVYYSER